MDGTRRPYARSFSIEQPGLTKPRLSMVPSPPDRRPGFSQQQRRVQQMDRNSDNSDSLHAQHQELVNQYKIALSELVFNSKPIITNLSIIAGENLHAEKAIAATICAHVIEVAPDRKLPSLYLLDSIVKNIGKDYVKYFSSRLPEVFCNAYWQVDPSTRQSMRHLFVTWRACFPSQVLQVIEKELGFSSTYNGSSGVSVSRADSQVQRPGHSIHVNPRYIERQQLQTSRARGSVSDISGSMVSSPKIAEAPRRSSTIFSDKSWSDPFVKEPVYPRDQKNEPIHNKYSTMASLDTHTDYDSDIPGLSGVATARMIKSFRDQGFNEPWHDYGSSVSGHLPDQKNRAGKKTGLEVSAAQKSTNHDLRLQRDQMFSFGNTNGVSKSWENSEEEEYSWEELNSKPTLAKDHLTSAYDDRLEVGIQYQEPQNLHETGPRIEDEPSVDSAPQELTRVITGGQVPFSWPENPHPPETSRIVSGLVSNIIGSEDYSLKFPENEIPGINVTTRPQLQTNGSVLSSMNSSVRRMSSPSLSNSSSIQPPYTSTERNQMSTGRPIDPRRPMLKRDLASRDQSSLLKLQPSTSLPPPQKKNYIPFEQGKLEVTEVEPSDVIQHSPVQSSPSSLLNTRTKDEVFRFDSSIKPARTRTPSPNATSSAPNPLSSLLSSLVAKGLIGASSSDKSSSALSQSPLRPADIASGLTTVGSISVSSTPLDKGKSPSVAEEQSSFEPAASPSCVSPQLETEKRNHVGFEFKPDVMRKFHPDLVADLVSDLPHSCDMCGVKFKFQELLDRHMEWHASDKMSRRWYLSSLDWVVGTAAYLLITDASDVMGESDEGVESGVPMVAADESQCACIFCGGLFEDFYSMDSNEWMFKGAVYLDISSSELLRSFESSASRNLIVHSHCISEESLHALGLTGNEQLGMLKMEED